MSVYGRLAFWFYHTLWVGIDWLFPPTCAGCGAQNKRWCVDCHRKLKLVGQSICPICGQPQENSQVCSSCALNPPRFSGLRSWAVFEGEIRQAVHRLKYEGDIALGEILAQYLVRCFTQQDWKIDLVIPVPLALDRLSERGYNQASLLAQPFAWQLDLHYHPGALTRVRETRSQVGLSAQERRDNVFGAFYAREKLVSGKNVLVIDDVTTTGSTLDACASALLDAGAVRVYGLTLAQASHRTEFQPI